MAKNKLQSGPRNPRSRSTKVPLTYYRSAKGEESAFSPFDQKRPRQSGLRKFFARVTDSFVVLVLILVLCYSLIVRSSPNLSLSSTAYHTKDLYQKTLVDKLDDVKNRNKITFDEAEIVGAMQKQFPEIASAQVELPLFNQVPKINLNISKPSFLFNAGGQSYVIDADGLAVGLASEFPGVKGLPVITDQTGFTGAKGKAIMSADGASFINTVLAQCKHAKVPVNSLTLPALAQELDLRTSDKPYFVKFYLGGDALRQTGQFLSTRKQLQDTHKEPAQYLDVRVDGKVFYK
jgi:cell division septal protein FtsQ